ncbi:dioxygenase [Rhodoferax sp.]|uniref:dioxygenase family protein n=1 Tax=Rhodoferax sp. TaxID=50421 RepID=UPI002715DFF8|nr:class III extradiol ring-cleavage dioxygenase [Rhodoferax sp.]MDO8317646.1 class III extradiol ring-cleavage dioxygenase [Rhodoferax sp.]MDP2677816.1 class III extradiol ring-cleavage dioxygenase [Rhodoferax sp.]
MNTTLHRAPVFFISHGSPMFALEPGQLGANLRALGQQLSGIKAVLVVSPHWQTRALQVLTTPKPETIHDFGGFPQSLYQLQYPAPGQPELAREALRLLTQAGWPTAIDANRGLDHGAWVPLWHLLPQATVPVFQVSMPHQLDTAGALALGRALAPLRDQGVLIVGSGSLTHNLTDLQPPAAPAVAYAVEFAHWIRQAVTQADVDGLLDYRLRAPHAERAHPTQEHFLPLLVALGARHESEAAQVIADDITYGVLSMESYVWGVN